MGRVFVRVPLPEWNYKRIAGFPIEMAFAHNSPAAAAENVIERRARVAMQFGLVSRVEELDLAGHRWVGESAGDGIDVAKQRTIVAIAVVLGHRF